MNIKAAIFDMDGILIDSEPLWFEAANEILKNFNVELSEEQYASSIGLRTPEFVEHWFVKLNLDLNKKEDTIKKIHESVITKIAKSGAAMPGVEQVLHLLQSKSCRIGLATSSSHDVIDIVISKLGIAHYFHAICSAEKLDHGKPHPQVYLDCAQALNIAPTECFCIEDSFNGMISAKAARMRCIVVPNRMLIHQNHWHAADMILTSLEDFNETCFEKITA